MSRDWYAHNPRDFIDGIIGLGPECIGAYITILDLIYLREGPIRNDGRWLSGIMGCSKRLADSLVLKLIEAGKLTLIDGHLSNVRAEFELENSAKLMRNQREWGANGGRMSAERRTKSNEINENVQGNLKQETGQDKTGQDIPISNEIGARAKSKRACRCPDDWQPSALAEPLASECMAMPSGWIERQLAGMRDWSKASPNGAKLDWDATWRGWLRRELKGQSNGRTAKPERDTSPSNPRVLAFARMAGLIPPDGRTPMGDETGANSGASASEGEHSWPARVALPSIGNH